jgi:hypothetical protein
MQKDCLRKVQKDFYSKNRNGRTEMLEVQKPETKALKSTKIKQTKAQMRRNERREWIN